jgi:hypothetical protein
MKKRIVYRVEDKRDPTTGTCSVYVLRTDWYDLPNPYMDNIEGIDDYQLPLKEWWCATISINQLLIWWKRNDLPELDRFGYRIAILEVPSDKVFNGRTQCIIDRNQSRLIGHVNPVTLEEVHYA